MKRLFLLSLLVAGLVLRLNAQNMGFEAPAVTPPTGWTAVTLVWSTTTAPGTVRTGSQAMQVPSPATSGSTIGCTNGFASVTTPGNYLITLAWGKCAGPNVAAMVPGYRNGTGNVLNPNNLAPQPASFNLNPTTWTRIVTVSAATVAPGNYGPALRAFSVNASAGVFLYMDDFIVYPSTSNIPDLSAPDPATNVYISGNSITWINGADNGAPASGVDGIVIIRTDGANVPVPTLNDQAMYAEINGTAGTSSFMDASSNTWTVVANITGGATNTFTDATAGTGPYTYAVYLRDMAYNYSLGVEPIIPLPCTNPPVAGTATSNPSIAQCATLPVTLNLTGASTGLNLTYQWQSSTTIGGPYTSIGTAQSSPHLVINPTTDLYYRNEIICNGGLPVYSAPIQVTVNPALPGATYTINSNLSTGGGNFQSFADAANAMACGITGPIVFNVDAASGPYNGQLILGDIMGTSSTNTITINGNGTMIGFASANANERAVIKLNGTDYVTIDSLIINANTGTYGFGVQLLNDADNNTISRCIINADLTSTLATNHAGILVNSTPSAITTLGSTLCDNNTITGNTVTGGYIGIGLLGNGVTSVISNNQVTNNTIKDFYLTGIHLNGGVSTIISGNDISRPSRPAMGNFQGIFLSGASTNTLINGNRLHNPFDGALTGTQAFFPIYLSSCNATAGNENIISNNLVYDAFGGSGNHNGVLNNASSYAKYVYNTIALEDAAATCSTCGTRGFYVQGTGATNLTFMNNVVRISRGGTGYMQGIFFEPTTVSQYVLNGNVYHISPAATGSYKEVARIAGSATVPATGSGFATIQNWQTGSLQEANSREDDPIFAGGGSYVPTNLIIDNIGIPVAGVSTDITGALRDVSLPDPGAYEFNNPLSVKLLNFGAQRVNTDVKLSWQVTDESGISSYEVERSGDGRQFSTVGRNVVTSGVHGRKTYQLTDPKAMAEQGELYYRLKVNSDNGSSHYSNVVKLSRHETMTASVKVYPNPFRDELLVNTDLQQESEGSILVADIFGRIVISQPVKFGAGVMISQVNGASELAHGIYTVIVDTGGDKYISKMAK